MTQYSSHPNPHPHPHDYLSLFVSGTINMKYRLTSESFLETGEMVGFLGRQILERIKHRPLGRYVDTNKHGGLWVILLLLASLMLLFGVIYLVYACIKTRRSYKDYSTRPETFTKQPEFNLIEQMNRQEYFFQPIRINKQSKEVEIVEKELMQGFVNEVTFPPSQEWASIRFNRKLEHTSYFEVQVLSMKAQLTLGYVHLKQYERRMKLSSEIGHVGIGIGQNGMVKINGIFMYNYQLKINYGDTIGVGLTRPDQRVWFTHNGKFLNPPTYIELEQWERDAINQDNLIDKHTLFERIFEGANEEKLPTDERVEDINTHDVERIHQRAKLNHDTFQFYAMVSCKSPTQGYLNINSGGQVFRYAVPEFQKGLFLEQYKQKFCGWIGEMCC